MGIYIRLFHPYKWSYNLPITGKVPPSTTHAQTQLLLAFQQCQSDLALIHSNDLSIDVCTTYVHALCQIWKPNMQIKLQIIYNFSML